MRILTAIMLALLGAAVLAGCTSSPSQSTNNATSTNATNRTPTPITNCDTAGTGALPGENSSTAGNLSDIAACGGAGGQSAALAGGPPAQGPNTTSTMTGPRYP